MESRKPDDKQNRKVFCGGLDLQTTDQTLGEYFCQFGDVEHAEVMFNKEKKMSRSFGFVIFADQEGYKACLKQKSHKVDGKEIDVKRAFLQQRNNQSSMTEKMTKKVFVGGLDSETTKQDIEDAFIGTGLTNVQIMTEQGTEKPRGFAFIYFDTIESAGKVCDQKWFKVKGRDAECKPAQSKENMEMEKARKRGGSYPQGMGMSYSAYTGYGYDYGARRGGANGGRYHDMYDHAQSGYPGFGRYPPSGYGYSSPGGYSYGPPVYDMYHSQSRGFENFVTPPTASSMGANYGQNASGYGPSRNSAHTDKGRSSSTRGNFNPYSRR